MDRRAQQEAQRAAKEQAKRDAEAARQAKIAAEKARKDAETAAKEKAKRDAEASRQTKVAAEKPAKEAAPAATDKTGSISAELYTGVVEFIVVPPTDIIRIKQLENCLRNIPNLRLVMFGGSVVEGTTFIVSIQEPIPLIDILGQQPPVEQITKEKNKKIMVKLKAAAPPGA